MLSTSDRDGDDDDDAEDADDDPVLLSIFDDVAEGCEEADTDNDVADMLT